MTKTLEQALLAHPFQVFRRYRRLTDEQKQTMARLFARHRKACERTDCDIDPRWLPECIEDVKRGIEV